MTPPAPMDAIVVLAWLVVGYKAPSLRRRFDDPACRFNWLTLLLMALALTALLPRAYLAIDRASGVPNLARLLGDGFGLAASWGAQALLFHLNFQLKPAAARTRVMGIILVTALLVMAGCFALAPLHDEALDFTGQYARTPFIFEYRLVFLAFLSVGMVNAVRLFWRYATLTRKADLRLGLRLAAAAAAIGLLYVTNEALRITTARLSLMNPIPYPGMVSATLFPAFIAVGLASTTVAIWAPGRRLRAAATWWRQYRSLHRLYPLWSALYQVAPEIALQPPGSRLGDLLSWRHVDFRVYRRVVEIRDGWLLLSPELRSRATDMARAMARAEALPGAEERAVIEATALAVALRAGRECGTSPGDDSVLEPSEQVDLDSEVRALERVARCYQRSPIVRVVIARLVAEQATHAPALQCRR